MIINIPINSLQFKQAMDNANRADKDFIPNYIRNNADVLKAISMIKNKDIKGK